MLAPSPVSPRSHRRTVAVLGLLGILLGCGPSEREIAAARARYAAAVDGFVVRQEPVPGRKLKQDVELGLTVRRDDRNDREGSEGGKLSGVTLDVDQVDAAGKGKRHWRVWIETAGLEPGREVRSVHVLEGVDYAPGDGFRVEVRQKIPEAERAGYRELSEAGGSATGSGPTS
jgi:hypothetical protein